MMIMVMMCVVVIFLLKNVSDVILFRSKDTKLVPIYYVLHHLIVSYIFKY